MVVVEVVAQHQRIVVREPMVVLVVVLHILDLHLLVLLV
tara:strand:- start:176 stop:292 length:117 start_codon:yes stop_codon:yes gene_type:complete